MSTQTLPRHDVKELSLAKHGQQRIEWAAPASLVNYDFLDGDLDFVGKLANAAR